MFKRSIPIAAGALLLCTAPALANDWLGLPEAASQEALEVDGLIHLVTWLVGITFVGVQVLLLWFLWKYRAKPGVKAKHTHGNHTVEMIWTVVPALILVFLALYQMDLWVRMKAAPPEEAGEPVEIAIFASQFQWDFRYPGPDGVLMNEDDLVTVNELVVPVDRPVKATMRSMDVLHSFYLPNFRFKQDAVPGITGEIWFKPTKLSVDQRPIVAGRDAKSGEYAKGDELQLDYWDIVCAELCGNGHTGMAGKLFVVSEEDYQGWLAQEDTDLNVGLYPVDDEDERGVWTRWFWQDEYRVPTAKPVLNREPFGEDDPYPVEEEDLGF